MATPLEIQEINESVLSYFADFDIINEETTFDILAMSEAVNIPVNDLHILLCNLEDEEIMQDIVDGEYYTFDAHDEHQFNDAYLDIMEQLGYETDEEEEEYED
jgi:NRPS condensation-like uncharacterized protein